MVIDYLHVPLACIHFLGFEVNSGEAEDDVVIITQLIYQNEKNWKLHSEAHGQIIIPVTAMTNIDSFDFSKDKKKRLKLHFP